jgi:hypothetical protein
MQLASFSELGWNKVFLPESFTHNYSITGLPLRWLEFEQLSSVFQVNDRLDFIYISLPCQELANSPRTQSPISQ